MEEILHQLIWSISHDLQGFIHLRWLFGISSINSSNRTIELENINFKAQLQLHSYSYSHSTFFFWGQVTSVLGVLGNFAQRLPPKQGKVAPPIETIEFFWMFHCYVGCLVMWDFPKRAASNNINSNLFSSLPNPGMLLSPSLWKQKQEKKLFKPRNMAPLPTTNHQPRKE